MPVATGTFRWTEVYKVNIAALDQQHRELFNAVNELDQALRAGEGNAALDAVLRKLSKYAEEHFAAEEALMAKYAFPGLPMHRAQHDNFRRKIAAFLEDQRAERNGVPVSLLFFIRDWLRDHLLKTDKYYAAFLNARGVH